MLLPEADTVAPKIISAAPPAPMKTAAALTTGVVDAARSGSVPSATTWASVMIAVTQAMVTISAKGTARRGSARLAGHDRDDFVAAEAENQQQPARRRTAQRQRLIDRQPRWIDREQSRRR